jgi:hypothetical protein
LVVSVSFPDSVKFPHPRQYVGTYQKPAQVVTTVVGAVLTARSLPESMSHMKSRGRKPVLAGLWDFGRAKPRPQASIEGSH